MEREQEKPIGAGLDSASATKRAEAAWEKARANLQVEEALVASAAVEAEKMLREQARTERALEGNECGSKMTAAELHEVLRNVIDSVEKACPEPDRASGTSVRSKSHAGPDKRQGQATARTRSRSRTARRTKVPKRRRIESLKTEECSNQDFDDDSNGFTTSEDEATPSNDRSIKTNTPSELAMMTGEDFDRHFFGTQ